MDAVLKTLGWLLIGVAGAVVLYPLFKPLVPFDPLIHALPAAVLVALGGQLLSQAKNISDANDKRSQFYLESCVEAYEEARKLLEDGNNDRVKWIAAGRALGHAKELASNVTKEAHLRVLELHRLKYRGVFDGALREKTAAFFFGAADPTMPTDEAAALSTAREQRGTRNTAAFKELSPKSISAVWEGAQWPKDYEDPLDRGFSPEEQSKLGVLFPGLHEFLEHKQRWQSASGRLHPRNK